MNGGFSTEIVIAIFDGFIKINKKAKEPHTIFSRNGC